VLGSQGSGGSQTGQRHLVRHRAPSARSIRNPVRSRVASAKYRNNGVRAESNAVCSRCRVRKEKIIRYVECSRCECKVKYGVPKERAVRSSRRDFADALYLSSAARRPVSSANLIDRSHVWSPYQSAAVGAVRSSDTEPSIKLLSVQYGSQVRNQVPSAKNRKKRSFAVIPSIFPIPITSTVQRAVLSQK